MKAGRDLERVEYSTCPSAHGEKRLSAQCRENSELSFIAKTQALGDRLEDLPSLTWRRKASANKLYFLSATCIV